MYVAGKRIPHAGRVIQRGEPIDDAEQWHNFPLLLRMGWIKHDPEVLAEAARIVRERRANEPTPAPMRRNGDNDAPMLPRPPARRPKPMR